MHRKLLGLMVGVIGYIMALPFSYADEPKSVILGRSEVPDHGTIALDATKSISDRDFKWEISGPDSIVFKMPGEVTRKGATAIDNRAYIMIPDAVPGVYKFKLTTIGWPKDAPTTVENIEVDAKEFVVNVTRVDPKPPTPGPTPGPGPNPGPNPPPAPPPDPVPKVEPGKFRVILLRESSQMIPLAQQYALDSIPVSVYLNNTTMTDGSVRGWRRYDPDANVSFETDTWKKAMTNARLDPRFKSVPNPKAIIFNGETPLEFSPIVDESTLLNTLKSFGGP